MEISAGKKVSIEYTLRLEDQTVVDTNVGAEPLTYRHGSNEIAQGLEAALEGMQSGESRRVTIEPGEGSDPLKPGSTVEVGKAEVPLEARKVGAELRGEDQTGRPFSVRVAEIKENSIVLDLKHPLAGKTLLFEVRVLAVR